MRRVEIMRQVESEFGERFWDVVRGFSTDGHSVQSTAELLGYSSGSAFRRLIKRHGITIEFADAQSSVFQVEARIARRGKCSQAQKAATERASAANPTYKRIAYGGEIDTLAGHARRLGVSISTVRKRYLVNPDPAYVFSTGSHVSVPKGKGWQSPECRARVFSSVMEFIIQPEMKDHE